MWDCSNGYAGAPAPPTTRGSARLVTSAVRRVPSPRVWICTGPGELALLERHRCKPCRAFPRRLRRGERSGGRRREEPSDHETPWFYHRVVSYYCCHVRAIVGFNFFSRLSRWREGGVGLGSEGRRGSWQPHPARARARTQPNRFVAEKWSLAKVFFPRCNSKSNPSSFRLEISQRSAFKFVNCGRKIFSVSSVFFRYIEFSLTTIHSCCFYHLRGAWIPIHFTRVGKLSWC